tara:strand:- start:35 stop:361 length:327 start_codon:yes stop_codon:yes gene_type:complete
MSKRNRRRQKPSKAKEQFSKLSAKERQILASARQFKQLPWDARLQIDGKFSGEVGVDGYTGYKAGCLGTEHPTGMKWPRAAQKKRALDDNTLSYRQTLTGYKSYPYGN